MLTNKIIKKFDSKLNNKESIKFIMLILRSFNLYHKISFNQYKN